MLATCSRPTRLNMSGVVRPMSIASSDAPTVAVASVISPMKFIVRR